MAKTKRMNDDNTIRVEPVGHRFSFVYWLQSEIVPIAQDVRGVATIQFSIAIGVETIAVDHADGSHGKN